MSSFCFHGRRRFRVQQSLFSFHAAGSVRSSDAPRSPVDCPCGRSVPPLARPPPAMSFRRALHLACGLAGGSAALLTAVAVVKKPWAADAEPAPPAPKASEPPGRGGWDNNWDRREPLSLINLRKRNEETGEEELASKLNKHKAKATRHIFLVRHSQYKLDGRADADRTLTLLGREQAEMTGQRLASLGFKYDHIVHSSMTRAAETTDIISKYLPGVKKTSTDLLREGAPIPPDPPISHWKPDAVQYYEDGARIEAAFRRFIHRADAKQEKDSYEVFICHANVIRYIVCRALQFPPEGWLRMSLNNGSITYLVIHPNGRVALRVLGETGFMPPEKITRT
ncbi:serine/threonine-protein phosphatase PGAM5, mitochondrial isoform X3 [Pleurodeles waltl]|uniref:serine/threonine-protein phosphatase PGAM5, mitochondrial isoform X3 n=1 Tax=Pleurodeles waltl TaxID=8319 RepID=UPI0037098286